MKVIRNEINGVTYANPSKPDCTLRVKHSSASKSLDGVATVNHVAEIIVNDLNTVTLGSKEVKDAVSVRIRISGATQSQGRVNAILKALGGITAKWEPENVIVGFLPETAPSDF